MFHVGETDAPTCPECGSIMVHPFGDPAALRCSNCGHGAAPAPAPGGPLTSAERAQLLAQGRVLWGASRLVDRLFAELAQVTRERDEALAKLGGRR